MSYLPELRHSLVRAAGRDRPRRIPRLGDVATAAAVIVVIAVAAIAFAATRHGAHGSAATHSGHSPQPQPHPLALMALAQAKVVKNDPACNPTPVPTGKLSTTGKLSNTVVSSLAVLRRPATLANNLPVKVATLVLPGAGPLREVHRARVVSGVAFYLIPIARLNARRIPSRCTAELQTALREASREQGAVDNRLGTVSSIPVPAKGLFCIYAVGARTKDNTCGATWAALIGPYATGKTKSVVSVVVSDEVASMTVTYAGIPPITVRPNNNIAFVPAPRGVRRPQKVVLHAADGKVIRVIKWPAGD